jgi:hypothetical protein
LLCDFSHPLDGGIGGDPIAAFTAGIGDAKAAATPSPV